MFSWTKRSESESAPKHSESSPLLTREDPPSEKVDVSFTSLRGLFVSRTIAKEDDDDDDAENPVTAVSMGLTKAFTCSPEETLDAPMPEDGVTDTMMYKNSTLVTWDAFRIGSKSVWGSSELWSMMFRLWIVSLCVCVLTLLVVPDPATLKIHKFVNVSKFLNVLVGLLLGFFLSSSMNRWHDCVNGFLELLDAIRNLQMQFVALGVPDDQISTVVRYGVASAWLLYGTLLVQWKKQETGPDSGVSRKLWDMIHAKTVNLDGTQRSLLESWEVEVLSTTRDPPSMMWLWIGVLIGKLAQSGDIPAMATPTYGRIMNLCQDGHGGIRTVRASITVQAPLPYTHTLAILVHINGILNALTFGIVVGCGLGVILIHHNMHFYHSRATGNEAERDVQTMLVTFMYTFFGPLLYQALLLISMHVAQPFDAEDSSMPLDRLLHSLEVDVRNGAGLMSKAMPGEDKPRFKQPPKSS